MRGFAIKRGALLQGYLALVPFKSFLLLFLRFARLLVRLLLIAVPLFQREARGHGLPFIRSPQFMFVVVVGVQIDRNRRRVRLPGIERRVAGMTGIGDLPAGHGMFCSVTDPACEGAVP